MTAALVALAPLPDLDQDGGVALYEVAAPTCGATLRIWWAPDWPTAGAPASGVAVEWCGQVGRPDSYVLVGGHLASTGAVVVEAPGDAFPAALVHGADRVRFGMTAAQWSGVLAALADLDAPVAVRVGGHAEAGSSPVTAYAGTAMLVHLLRDGLPGDDHAVWALWRSCVAAARRRS